MWRSKGKRLSLILQEEISTIVTSQPVNHNTTPMRYLDLIITCATMSALLFFGLRADHQQRIARLHPAPAPARLQLARMTSTPLPPKQSKRRRARHMPGHRARSRARRGYLKGRLRHPKRPRSSVSESSAPLV